MHASVHHVYMYSFSFAPVTTVKPVIVVTTVKPISVVTAVIVVTETFYAHICSFVSIYPITDVFHIIYE